MIDHVFLPPRLPQEDDTDPQHVLAMVQALCDSVRRFLSVETTSLSAVQPALKMLEHFLSINLGLDLDGSSESRILPDAIANLKQGGTYN